MGLSDPYDALIEDREVVSNVDMRRILSVLGRLSNSNPSMLEDDASLVPFVKLWEQMASSCLFQVPQVDYYEELLTKLQAGEEISGLSSFTF